MSGKVPPPAAAAASSLFSGAACCCRSTNPRMSLCISGAMPARFIVAPELDGELLSILHSSSFASQDDRSYHRLQPSRVISPQPRSRCMQVENESKKQAARSQLARTMLSRLYVYRPQNLATRVRYYKQPNGILPPQPVPVSINSTDPRCLKSSQTPRW